MRKKYLLATLMFVIVTACNEQDYPSDKAERGIETISAEIIQPVCLSSRIVIGKPDTDGTIPVKWRTDNPATRANEADAIYVYDSKGNASRFVYVEGEDASVGTFYRDKKVGKPIFDIKIALCVPSSTTFSKQLPATADAPFNYVSPVVLSRGAENLPMYGSLGEDGILKFRQATGLLEIDIPDINDFRAMNEAQTLVLKVIAYDEHKKKRNISALRAKLVTIGDTDEMELELVESPSDFIGILIEQETKLNNTKLYSPLLFGNYSSLELQLFPDESLKEPCSKQITIFPPKGQEFMTVDKSVLSVTALFKDESPDSEDSSDIADGLIETPVLPGGDNEWQVN